MQPKQTSQRPSARPTGAASVAARSPRPARRIATAAGVALAACAGLLILLVAGGADGTAEDGREHLANLSPSEQAALERKREAFEELDESERQRMRMLHAAISASPDNERLRSVMRNYYEWLKTLTNKQRADLLQLPPQQRIDEIKQLIEEQQQKPFRDLVRTELEPQDVRAIFGWLNHYVENHEEELRAMLPEGERRSISQMRGPPSMRRGRLLMALGSRELDAQLPAPTDEEIQKLDGELTDKATKALAEVATREDKLRLVREWVRAAFASRMAPRVSHEQLMEFYQKFKERTDDETLIERLDALPPDEFYEAVKPLYFRSRGHWRGRRGGEFQGPQSPFGGRDRSDGDGPRRPGENRRPPDVGEGGPPRRGDGTPERFGNSGENRGPSGPRFGPRGNRPLPPPSPVDEQ